MSNFIEVYSKTTGRKQWVPEHYIGNPVLGADFEIVPSKRATQPTASAIPDETWKRAQLDEYATALGLDTAGLPNKAAVLAAIAERESAHIEAPEVVTPDADLDENHDDADQTDVDHQTTDDTESSDETPA